MKKLLIGMIETILLSTGALKMSQPRSATDIPSATILRINKEPCFIAVSEIGKDKQLTFVPSNLEKSGFTLLSQMM